ncbi:MAG: group II intron reverse transcriptase/maturase [Acutalibacteraceae bacterium]|nr:group II intron reverse transcriptase/maturase [Acutalibacteraceae bacterium]
MPVATKTVKKIRHNEYYNIQEVFDNLYELSRKGTEFDKLIPIISARDNILLAYRNIKRHKGSHTSGIDGKTIEDIEKLSEEKLVDIVQKKLKRYRPKAVKRVEIPKTNGTYRPLGIPTIMDRIVQQCILQVLEPICEAKFYKHSYGFRPDRSTEHAIARCYSLIQRSNLHYVVNFDIKNFFDNVNHSKLIKQMWSLGIRDKTLICIIKQILTADIILPDGTKVSPNKGTPQGGILSPLLANIVLNELDQWVSSQWETMPAHNVKTADRGVKGMDRSHAYRAFRNTTSLKEMYIVRYADDFKIFCRNAKDAQKVYIATKSWIETRLKLEVNPEKSGVTNLRRNYSEFLGFKMKVQKKGNKMTVKSHVSDKAMKNIVNEARKQIIAMQRPKNNRNFLQEVNKYNAKVIGWHIYYSKATHVSEDFRIIAWKLKKCLNKRLILSKTGEFNRQSVVYKRYGESKQIRFLSGITVAPIAYVVTDPPSCFRRDVCKYTEEGRVKVHDSLKVDMQKLRQLMMSEPRGNYSIEYYDNRISLYSAQYGRCFVTGKELEVDEIHCHHKKPRANGGTDAYKNLTIVHTLIHRLIHAVNSETINKYMYLIENEKQLKKLNVLRELVGHQPIIWNFS